VKTGPRERPPIEKRPSQGRLRAIFLAVAVHAAFIAVIVFGVNWQSAPTAPVQAELWSQLPTVKQAAKATPPKPEPPKPPPPKPEPPKPEPPKPEPPKPEPKVEPPKVDPEIALKAEREKREKEKREQAERDKREKAEKEKAEKKRQEEARKQLERDQAEQMKREQAERARQQQVAQERAAAAAAAQQKEFNEWIDRIRARIRGRANVPDSVTGKPTATFLIRILPGGEVLDIKLKKSSGNPAYDNAIERGIRSASPLPVPPPTSELFPRFRELNLEFQHER
jgi:colicin import membrane protein